MYFKMEYKDYYKILGVDRDISQAELKKSYRKLARKYHPDVSKEKNAEERFKEINEAYEVLGDEENRSQYDNLGANWKSGQNFNPPPGWEGGFDFNQFGQGGGSSGGAGFSDFFESMFGGAGGGQQGFHQRQAKPPAEVMHSYVELEEVYAGSSKRITLPSGSSIEVKIPKGIEDGKKIRLSGKGSNGADIHLQIKYRKHSVFKLDGKDVFIDLPIAPWEAVLGANATIQTLGGQIKLKIPENSSSGKKMRLKGRGLPGSINGDQFVVLQIVMPPIKSEKDKVFYEEMQKKFDWRPR